MNSVYKISSLILALFLLLLAVQESYIKYKVATYKKYKYYEYDCNNDYELCEVTCAVRTSDSKIAFILARFSRLGREHGIGFESGGGYSFISGRYSFRTYYADDNTPLPNYEYNYFEVNSEPMSPEVTYKSKIKIPTRVVLAFYKTKGRPSYRWNALKSFFNNQKSLPFHQPHGASSTPQSHTSQPELPFGSIHRK